MNKTKIGWVKNPDGTQGYTWNPITGCLNGCEYCYARKLANTRLKERYLANKNLPDRALDNVLTQGNPFYPRFWPERLDDLHDKGFQAVDGSLVGKAKGIFICDMSDLFGIGIPEEWTRQVFATINCCPNHRLYLLTKQPQNLPKWSPFPPNCFVGVSVTQNNQLADALKYLCQIEATVKFISFEPLLGHIELDIALSIGYNTEYESKKQRVDSISSGKGRGIRDRFQRADMESQGPEVGQVERGEQDNSLCPSKSRERYGEIPPSKNDGERDTLSCVGTQAGMVSLQRGNTESNDSQSQKRKQQGQLPRKFGNRNIQPTDKTFNTDFGENLQARQTRALSWVIIGACTGTKDEILEPCKKYPALTPIPYGKRWTAQPRIEWVREIVEACDKARIPVFLKDNLKPLFHKHITVDDKWALNSEKDWPAKGLWRQEMPANKLSENQGVAYLVSQA